MKKIIGIIKSIVIGGTIYFLVVGLLWALEKVFKLTIGTIEPGTVMSYVLDVGIIVIVLLVFWGIGNAVRNR